MQTFVLVKWPEDRWAGEEAGNLTSLDSARSQCTGSGLGVGRRGPVQPILDLISYLSLTVLFLSGYLLRAFHPQSTCISDLGKGAHLESWVV